VAWRLPQVRRWYVAARRTKAKPLARAALVAVTASLFGYGLHFFVHDLAISGSQAFMQHPEG
jgi:hypothetical protein